MDKLSKVKYEDYVRTTEMFYVDPAIDIEIEKEVSNAVSSLCHRMQGINSIEGLKDYIKTDENSLEYLINLMNISSEKFKRVITTLRVEKGHEIHGEWSLDKVRTMMLERPGFMDEVCDLLLNGANNPKYTSIIPMFYLENFVINSSTMARLYNPDDLRRLIKKGLEGKYNSSISNSYYHEIELAVKDACDNEGVDYSAHCNVPLIGRTVDFVIPDEKNPTILIDLSYNVTTSSTQTRYKDKEEKAASIIREYNRNAANPIALVNVLDGAGWVGRQSDLRAIYMCSTYVLHISTKNDIAKIVSQYC